MAQFNLLEDVLGQAELVIQVPGHFLLVYIPEVDVFLEVLQVQEEKEVLASQQRLDGIGAVRREHHSIDDPGDRPHAHFIVVVLHLIKHLPEALHHAFRMNDVVIYQVDAILGLLEDIVQVLRVWALQLLAPTYLQVTLTHFLAYCTPEHVALPVFLE